MTTAPEVVIMATSGTTSDDTFQRGVPCNWPIFKGTNLKQLGH